MTHLTYNSSVMFLNFSLETAIDGESTARWRSAGGGENGLGDFARYKHLITKLLLYSHYACIDKK